MPSPILQSSLVIVGPGRAGAALARSWIAAGGGTPRLVARNHERAEAAASRVRGARPVGWAELPPSSSCDTLVLAVSDDQIARAASQAARAIDCRRAYHLSGLLSDDVLAPLAARGASVGSLHPLRAFAGEPDENWTAAFVAIDARGEALETATQLLAAIGAYGHPISAEAKPLYHAGATLSAGGAVALLSMAVRLWERAGLAEQDARRALSELAVQALMRAGRLEFEAALTGPIARRDIGTLRAHRDALARFPEVLRVYVELARETLRRTPGRGLEEEIEKLLLEIPSQPTG